MWNRKKVKHSVMTHIQYVLLCIFTLTSSFIHFDVQQNVGSGGNVELTSQTLSSRHIQINVLHHLHISLYLKIFLSVKILV